jgi:hypothetical protein
MNFAKLTFAVPLGFTYSNAKVLTVNIQAKKGTEVSNNGGNVLIMPIRLSVGNLFGNRDIDIHDGIIYSSNSTSEILDQGVTTIRIDNQWSKNEFRTQLTTTNGIHARNYADTDSPTGRSLIFSMADTDRTKLWRTHIVSFDVDGFPNYGARLDVLGVGAAPGPATSAPSEPVVVPEYFSGGMPLILIGKISSTKTSSILANTGTPASPDYSTFLRTTDIDIALQGVTLMRSDSLGKIYIPIGGAASVGRLYRLTYSGANNNATALTTVGNWSNEEIGATATVSPALNGDGQTFQGHAYGVAIDEDNPVNGQPTLYATDDANHVIWEITHKGTAFGDGRDWDWLIIAGTAGTAGNVDAIGLAAEFNVPTGIIYDGAGFLYVNDFGSRTMRKINISTLDVETFFGQAGVGAHVDQFPY